MKNKLVIFLLSIFLILTSCTGIENKKVENKIDENSKENVKIENTKIPEEKPPEIPQKTSARIKFFGDIMFNYPQVRAALQPDGSYNFRESFSEVKDFIEDADLSIANFESTSNQDLKYSGYPRFNTPPEVFFALKDAGFDILSTMNNHTADSGANGVITTIQNLEGAGLLNFGTSFADREKFRIAEIKGIKLGLLSYSQSLNGLDSYFDTEIKKDMINNLEPEKIKEDIESLKNDCDLIIVYPHWGNEYQSEMNEFQINLAHDMLEWGADIIIGNHPHVVQPTEKYTTSDGRECFIAYSLGNFLSNQREETFIYAKMNVKDPRRTEQNIAYEIEIEKDLKTGETQIKEIIYHPMWVGVRNIDGKKIVKSHLCSQFLEGGEKYDSVDEIMRTRIEEAFQKVTETTKTLDN